MEDEAEAEAERDQEMRARISRYFSRKPKVAPPIPTKNKELEAVNRFKQRARRAKELEHRRYQSMMNKVGAAVQRQSVEDTFAKAEQLYLSRVQVAQGAKTLSVSQCLDALQESLNELRSKYSSEHGNLPAGVSYKPQNAEITGQKSMPEGSIQAQEGVGRPDDLQALESERELTGVRSGNTQARRPKLFQSAETDRIKEVAEQWIKSARVIGNIRVEQEVRNALKGVYGIDIVEKVEEVRKFIDHLDSDHGKVSKRSLPRNFIDHVDSNHGKGHEKYSLPRQPVSTGFWWQELEDTDEEAEEEEEEVQEDSLGDMNDEGVDFDGEHARFGEPGDEEEVYEGREDEGAESVPFLYVLCPMERIIQRLRSLGIIAEKTRLPKPVSSITNLPDATIINWFRSKAYLILKQYRPVNNIWEVRRLINFHIRWSLLYTLAKKHKCSASKIIKLYGKAPSVKIPTMVWRGQVVYETVADFPSVHQVNGIRRGFDRQTWTPWEFDDLLLVRCKRDGAPEQTIPAMTGSGISADKV